jgi:Mrp family chromosome partitioning ATPase
MLLAQAGGSVCLVEANSFTPAFSSIFTIGSEGGLSEAIEAGRSAASFARQIGNSRLWVIAAGSRSANSSIVLRQPEVSALLAELKSDFTHIIIDAPPISHPETMILGRLTDGVILVLEAARTRRDSTTAAAEHLRSAQIPILGAVLNKRVYPIPESLYSRL